MPNLNTAALIKWSCPCPRTGAPTPDADGNRLLVHVVDSVGNNFEITCRRGFGGWNHWYEYSLSFPTGTPEVLSKCIYTLGLNDVSVSYTGTMTPTTNASGTPVITVGTITLVEHSNIEATGAPGLGIPLKPKAGGEDFHVFYLCGKKVRYRVNTKIGSGGGENVVDTSFFSRSTVSPEHSILRAESAPFDNPAAYASALASDTSFRRLDFPDTKEPEDQKYQDADYDEKSLGFAYLESGGRRGAIILDATFSGSSVELVAEGVELLVPACVGRDASTFAIEHGLVAECRQAVSVTVDGEPAELTELGVTDSMVAFRLSLNQDMHRVFITKA